MRPPAVDPTWDWPRRDGLAISFVLVVAALLAVAIFVAGYTTGRDRYSKSLVPADEISAASVENPTSCTTVRHVAALDADDGNSQPIGK